MFGFTLPRLNEVSATPTSALKNPYKAQKPWPPDFTKLHPKYQFRLERRYRRRAKLKWARPGWTKGVKMVASGSCLFVLGYGILYMDWGADKKAFQGIRSWVKKQTDSIWTTNQPKTHTAAVEDVDKGMAASDARRRT